MTTTTLTRTSKPYTAPTSTTNCYWIELFTHGEWHRVAWFGDENTFHLDLMYTQEENLRASGNIVRINCTEWNE